MRKSICQIYKFPNCFVISRKIIHNVKSAVILQLHSFCLKCEIMQNFQFEVKT